MRLLSEHIVLLTKVEMRDMPALNRAGKRIKAVMRYVKKMRKSGCIIEPIQQSERGYTGKGLFYGIRVFAKQ